MATDVATMPAVNGYAPHQGYGSLEQQPQNPYTSSTPASAQSLYEQPRLPDSAAVPPPATTPTHSEVPKDEVGWYFVEQYYTTLSRSPEKLYLFYNKRSQFVSGQETDKVPVCVGQRAINDRIKELAFHDCKVRVTNVDSQASDSNIVIQVIGEMSNKGQPHKKFAQTFVLAAQTNGYFVLNDVFRYLIEEEEEEVTEQEAVPHAEEEIQQVPAAESGFQEPLGTTEESAHETLTSSTDPVAVQRDAEEVAREFEEKVVKAEEPEKTQVNGDSSPEHTETNHVEEESAAPAVAETEKPSVEEASREVATEDAIQPEKPKDPSPSPVATPAAQPPTQPAAPPKPSAPKTWASLAASANRVATPQAPQQPSSQPRQTPAPKPQAAPASAPSPAPSATPSAPPPAPVAPREDSAPQDEWTAVSSTHARQQSRQTNTVTQQQEPGPNSRGYIKNVHEGIQFEDLEAAMKRFGELVYFDIARQKNSAFVDFKTPEAYQAAVAANPHTIGSTELFVEERRIRPGSTPYVPRGGPYASRGPARGGYRGRGDFGPRGRGAPRGARGGGAPPQGA